MRSDTSKELPNGPGYSIKPRPRGSAAASSGRLFVRNKVYMPWNPPPWDSSPVNRVNPSGGRVAHAKHSR